MSLENLLFEVDTDGIALLSINRPDKLNALDAHVISELESVFADVRDSTTIRALIVTGSGPKAFVAGADVNELAMLTPRELYEMSRRGQKLYRELELMPKPSVAAINGYALGGGLELAMACTIRIASPNAIMGQPEVKLGVMPGYGGTQRLPALVGRGKALEMLLSGEPIDAEEANRVGLVNHIAPQDRLVEACRIWLRKVLSNGPLAVAMTLQAVDMGLQSGIENGMLFEAASFSALAATQDRLEGTRAFVNKRKPVFTGR